MIRLPSSILARSAWLLLAVLAGCSEEKPAEKPKTETNRITPEKRAQVPLGKGFDFYVLSLSWSPTWCAENDSGGRTQQCRRGEDNGFIVHGLWPQNERGYPEYCSTRESDRVPESLGRTVLDIIPSMGLIGHQWRKHGTCSGLAQQDYFATLRRAYERVKVPAFLKRRSTEMRILPNELERQFIATNPGLSPAGIAVTCEADKLEEVRICLTRDLDFRPCPEVDRGGCRRPAIAVPPID